MSAIVQAPRSPDLETFRRRALSVTAAVFCAGMATMALVLPLTSSGIGQLDVSLLVAAATVHLVAALTVERWEPGGGWSVTYIAVIVVLVGVAVADAPTVASDAFWFMLLPVGLSALVLPVRDHIRMTAVALIGYAVALDVGPGYDVAVAAPRSVALVLFAVVLRTITYRLEHALAQVAASRATLERHLAEVQQVNERLSELDRLKDDFVSTASHELRTPLTMILGFARTLDDRWEQLSEPQRRQFVARVESHAQSLVGIVTTVLDTARIERGTLVASEVDVWLAAAVAGAIDRLRPMLRDHRVVAAGALDTAVRTDPQLLERVLDNLLSNAARHTPAGSTVIVRAERTEGLLRVEVADDGPGIPPDELGRLGERFFRAGDPDTRTRDGVGLGLALVSEVLGVLGSELRVASEHGAGTTFSFDLQVVAEDRVSTR